MAFVWLCRLGTPSVDRNRLLSNDALLTEVVQAHLLTSRAIVTPLLAGNTVVLKTSEITPHTQCLWAELLFAAGLPRSCLSVVHIATEDAANLVES